MSIGPADNASKTNPARNMTTRTWAKLIRQMDWNRWPSEGKANERVTRHDATATSAMPTMNFNVSSVLFGSRRVGPPSRGSLLYATIRQRTLPAGETSSKAPVFRRSDPSVREWHYAGDRVKYLGYHTLLSCLLMAADPGDITQRRPPSSDQIVPSGAAPPMGPATRQGEQIVSTGGSGLEAPRRAGN